MIHSARVLPTIFLAFALIASFACERAPKEDTFKRAPIIFSPQASEPSTAASEPSQMPPVAPPPQAEGSIVEVAQRVTPSVVSVFSEKTIQVQPEMVPFFGERFFHPGMPQSHRQQSLGSGVIVSSDGIIITNHHVVAGGEKIRVALKDQRELVATIIGTDPQSDVAVLKVEAQDLPALPIADSSKLQVGEVVLAIGNPFNLGQTVTAGIISAVGRANMGITDYEDFIQTDAAINPGNSGGALINLRGELVGINTAILSQSGAYQGIGFAIPSNMALQVKDALVTNGKVVRGWLGVAIQAVTEDLAESLGLTPRVGVLVSSVSPGSPAAQAGLKRGDVITEIDGTKINDPAQLRNQIAYAGKGKKLRVDFLRDGKEQSLEVTLGELPSEAQSASAPQGKPEATGLFSGLRVQPLDATLRARLQVPTEVEGMVVTSAASSRAGLRVGDVIVELNQMPVRSMKDFIKAASASEERALLLVYREGSTFYLVLSR